MEKTAAQEAYAHFVKEGLEDATVVSALSTVDPFLLGPIAAGSYASKGHGWGAAHWTGLGGVGGGYVGSSARGVSP